MVVGEATRDAAADRLFHALSDATRRDIVGIVLGGDRSVSELARRYPMSFAAVQKHVAVLERAGLVTKQRHGREQRVHGDVTALRTAAGLLDRIEEIWRERMASFDEVLDQHTRAHRHTDRQGDHP